MFTPFYLTPFGSVPANAEIEILRKQEPRKI